MKTTWKQIAATVMAIFMLVAAAPFVIPGVPAGAVEVETPARDLTVTIPGQMPGAYTAYAFQVLQVQGNSEVSESGTDARTYPTAESFTAFFSGAQETYADMSEATTLYLVNEDGVLGIVREEPASEYIRLDNAKKLDSTYFAADIISRITDNSAGAQHMANWLTLYALANNVPPTQTKTADGNAAPSFQFEGLDDGYYLIYAEVSGTNTDSKEGLIVTQSILDLQKTSVELKATTVTMDKSVTPKGTSIDTDADGKADHVTAGIGDALNYSVTSQIPVSFTNYDLVNNSFVYSISDTMKNQMLDADTVAVTIGSTKLTRDGTSFKKGTTAVAALTNGGYDNGENSFAVDFDLAALGACNLFGQSVTVTYSATLMDEAGDCDAQNAAVVEYSSNPYDASSRTRITDTTKVYTYDVAMQKVFSDGATDIYDGVTFELFLDAKCENPVLFNAGTDTYIRSDDGVTGSSVLQLDDEGKLLLHGLGEGTYYLKETMADDLKAKRYEAAGLVTITIQANGELKLTDANCSVSEDTKDLFKDKNTMANKLAFSTDGEHTLSFTLWNQRYAPLPFTGGIGTEIFVTLGILILAADGAAILYTRRKKRNEA